VDSSSSVHLLTRNLGMLQLTWRISHEIVDCKCNKRIVIFKIGALLVQVGLCTRVTLEPLLIARLINSPPRHNKHRSAVRQQFADHNGNNIAFQSKLDHPQTRYTNTLYRITRIRKCEVHTLSLWLPASIQSRAGKNLGF